jgi:tRNA threonylcarbamoyladenosine biosynthesis protein TsaB
MRVLGVDTASPTASVAIVEDGALVAEEVHDRANDGRGGSSPALKGNHAEIVLPLIQSVLAKSASQLDELAGIAVSIGPGSFTGLRIGLATVKGLVYGWGLPVVGVSTLLANAACGRKFAGLLCAVLDARKREVYVALFQSDGDRLTRLTEDAIMSLRNAVDLVQFHRSKNDAPAVFLGDGVTAYGKFLVEALAPHGRVANGHCSVAAAAAALGEEHFRNGAGDDLGALAPVYLRPSEAESGIVKCGLTY